jgi:hypothetical protein
LFRNFFVCNLCVEGSAEVAEVEQWSSGAGTPRTQWSRDAEDAADVDAEDAAEEVIYAFAFSFAFEP